MKDTLLDIVKHTHALGFLIDWSKEIPKDQTILFLLSGRGDKDMETVSKKMESL